MTPYSGHNNNQLKLRRSYASVVAGGSTTPTTEAGESSPVYYGPEEVMLVRANFSGGLVWVPVQRVIGYANGSKNKPSAPMNDENVGSSIPSVEGTVNQEFGASTAPPTNTTTSTRVHRVPVLAQIPLMSDSYQNVQNEEEDTSGFEDQDMSSGPSSEPEEGQTQNEAAEAEEEFEFGTGTTNGHQDQSELTLSSEPSSVEEEEGPEFCSSAKNEAQKGPITGVGGQEDASAFPNTPGWHASTIENGDTDTAADVIPSSPSEVNTDNEKNVELQKLRKNNRILTGALQQIYHELYGTKMHINSIMLNVIHTANIDLAKGNKPKMDLEHVLKLEQPNDKRDRDQHVPVDINQSEEMEQSQSAAANSGETETASRTRNRRTAAGLPSSSSTSRPVWVKGTGDMDASHSAGVQIVGIKRKLNKLETAVKEDLSKNREERVANHKEAMEKLSELGKIFKERGLPQSRHCADSSSGSGVTNLSLSNLKKRPSMSISSGSDTSDAEDIVSLSSDYESAVRNYDSDGMRNRNGGAATTTNPQTPAHLKQRKSSTTNRQVPAKLQPCNSTSTINSRLLIHHERNLNVKGYVCTCGEHYKSPGGLNIHIRIHGPPKVVCTICGCKFHCLVRLNNHKKRSHQKTAAELDRAMCYHCFTSFPTAQDLNKHQHKCAAKQARVSNSE